MDIALAQGFSIKAIHIQELRDRVLAAWSSGSSTQIKWLVADQLGTPRMIFDQTGSLANVSRHDYLPFGEELFAGTGGRTQAQGYSASDGVRQKFTQKERDIETGLDYFLARYYSSTQGRFTSPDEFTGGPDELYDFAETASDNPIFYADLSNPQSLNKYQYSYNNPLRYVDPDGHDPDSEVETDCCDQNPETQKRVATGAAIGAVIGGAIGTVVGANAGSAAGAGAGTLAEPGGGTIAGGVSGGVAGGASGAVHGSAAGAVIGGLLGYAYDRLVGPSSPTALPVPTTGTPPSQQSQPLPPPAPIQARKQVFKNFPTRKAAMDARPKPQPAKPGEPRVTRQTKNKAGMGTKSEIHKQGGRHVHDDRHKNKKKPNRHYGFPD